MWAASSAKYIAFDDVNPVKFSSNRSQKLRGLVLVGDSHVLFVVSVILFRVFGLALGVF